MRSRVSLCVPAFRLAFLRFRFAFSLSRFAFPRFRFAFPRFRFAFPRSRFAFMRFALRFRVSLWRLCTQKNLRNTVPQVSVSLVVREFRFSREG